MLAEDDLDADTSKSRAIRTNYKSVITAQEIVLLYSEAVQYGYVGVHCQSKRWNITCKPKNWHQVWNHKLRKDIEINLWNKAISEEQRPFFHREDVTKGNADTKKMVKNSENKSDTVPACYRLSSLSSSHERFLAGSNLGCSLSYFRQNCPYYILKPHPNYWGTCSRCRTFNQGWKQLARLLKTKIWNGMTLEIISH